MKLEDLRSKLMQAKLKDKLVRSYLTCNKKQPGGKYCNFCIKKETTAQSLNLFRKLGDLTVDNKECYDFIQPIIQSKERCNLAQPLARERQPNTD